MTKPDFRWLASHVLPRTSTADVLLISIALARAYYAGCAEGQNRMAVGLGVEDDRGAEDLNYGRPPVDAPDRSKRTA